MFSFMLANQAIEQTFNLAMIKTPWHSSGFTLLVTAEGVKTLELRSVPVRYGMGTGIPLYMQWGWRTHSNVITRDHIPCQSVAQD